jgi:hypothetical protein
MHNTQTLCRQQCKVKMMECSEPYSMKPPNNALAKIFSVGTYTMKLKDSLKTKTYII